MDAFRETRARFESVHVEGMAALKRGDLAALGDAIAAEKDLIDKQRVIIDKQRAMVEAALAPKKP